jgi:hypothetical protein
MVPYIVTGKLMHFPQEFNFAIRKILKHGNGIPISIRYLNLLNYELNDKQVRALKEAVDAYSRTLSGVSLVPVDSCSHRRG